MKKSLQFKEAQLAVLSNQKIEPQDKLEILSTLMECESLEIYRESQAEGENNE